MNEQLAALRAQAAKAAEVEDQSEVEVFTGGELPPAGLNVARLVEYIDFGIHKQKPFKGKAKEPCAECRITFELTHPSLIKEIELEDGTKKKIAPRISLNITKKLSERAKFKKLFAAMTYGRPDIKHIAMCVGDPYILNIIHTEPEEGKRQYANLFTKDGACTILPPIKKGDPLEQTADEDISGKIPAPLGEYRMFLWDFPSAEAWDALYIEGTREQEVEDEKGNKVKKEVSKNWMQDKIKGSTNYVGSLLETMLSKTADLPITEEADTQEVPFDVGGGEATNADDALKALDL